MNFLLDEPVSARKLIDDFYRAEQCSRSGKVIRFTGIKEGYDVYNPSIPFKLGNRNIIAGRVERRDFYRSDTMFFEERKDGSYALIPDAPVISGLEDPAVTVIGNDLILCGTHALWKPDGSLITYHADFYRLHDLNEPEFLFEGPDYMKDIRLLDLLDGRIAITSRPRDTIFEKYGRHAAIGFEVVKKLSDINADVIKNAPLMQWHFVPEEWGGINQMFLLKNGKIGAIGHIAWGESGALHYYGFAQSIDIETGSVTPVKIIGCRSCYEDAPAKRPDLGDVTFTSGIIRKSGNKADLYTGLSDSYCGIREIDDPLSEYEA